MGARQEGEGMGTRKHKKLCSMLYVKLVTHIIGLSPCLLEDILPRGKVNSEGHPSSQGRSVCELANLGNPQVYWQWEVPFQNLERAGRTLGSPFQYAPP
jgi:hypothetical protein